MRSRGEIAGGFSAIEASLVVQSVLDMLADEGLVQGNTHKLAAQCVWLVNDQLFDMGDQPFAPVPGKITMAAAAFASAIQIMRPDDPNGVAYKVGLAKIMREIGTHEPVFTFNGTDEALLEMAVCVFEKCAADVADSSLW